VHVERVFAQQLGAARRVSLLVARAEVLPDEGAVAVGKVAVVDLLGIVCAVSVSYLCDATALHSRFNWCRYRCSARE
jgi:hypothetical protein